MDAPADEKRDHNTDKPDGSCSVCGYNPNAIDEEPEEYEYEYEEEEEEEDDTPLTVLVNGTEMTLAEAEVYWYNTVNLLTVDGLKAANLNAAEAIALKTADRKSIDDLPAVERMLATMAAAGMGDAAEALIETFALTVSDEGMAAIEEMKARFAAMTEAEQNKVLRQRERMFPTVRVDYHNELANYYVVTDGRDNYGVREDPDAGWVCIELPRLK